eukprot:CAMPEP_0201597160 /NCGR_PEP_ID=MMETSP0190_2-20130828/193716_1 /ASSEMBLY_ACC=CAM_ASM_000263 /TAXON_ID=37353 /ORGANISM="Rosalina sp." /LENGTH=97 /DNA_ID=CAMNT_0048057973 /DNA_START=1000 /DNA_END=1293 /DNA_ORIENTATION=-
MNKSGQSSLQTTVSDQIHRLTIDGAEEEKTVQTCSANSGDNSSKNQWHLDSPRAVNATSIHHVLSHSGGAEEEEEVEVMSMTNSNEVASSPIDSYHE